VVGGGCCRRRRRGRDIASFDVGEPMRRRGQAGEVSSLTFLVEVLRHATGLLSRAQRSRADVNLACSSADSPYTLN
jgi:hypothetical protein